MCNNRHLLHEARAGGRAVDLGGANVYQGGPKFEIKHNSRCLQKSKLVNWGGASMSIGGPGPPALENNALVASPSYKIRIKKKILSKLWMFLLLN